MWGVDYKKRLEEYLIEDIQKYLNENQLTDIFDLPILGYADAADPRFLRLVRGGLNMHPKEIYRPGSTVIISFLPFSTEYVKSNFNGEKSVSQEWKYAYERSIIISSHINGLIQKLLVDMGREASLTTLPNDWDREIYGPEWCHKYGAYIAGMGNFGTGGCISTSKGSYGRFNSIITELRLEPTTPVVDDENIIANISKASMFKGDYDLDITAEIMAKCPADAIKKDGIDRAKCQKFCETLGQTVPEADACGKCFV